MLNKKNIFITGASAGIGEALAFHAANLGANLSLCARRVDKLKELKEKIEKQFPKVDVFLCPADVCDKGQMAAAILKSAEHFKTIDVFIANAGKSMWSRFSDLADPDEINDLMQLNFMGLVYGLFFSLPHLRECKGSFVAVSSVQGVMPVPYHTGYVASKYAVNGLIESIRMEEPDVHFMLSLPSWISGTELRSHALTGSQEGSIKVKKSHGKSATTPKDCAAQIFSALLKKQDQHFVPKSFQLIPFARQILRKTVDKIVVSKVDKQLK